MNPFAKQYLHNVDDTKKNDVMGSLYTVSVISEVLITERYFISYGIRMPITKFAFLFYIFRTNSSLIVHASYMLIFLPDVGNKFSRNVSC